MVGIGLRCPGHDFLIGVRHRPDNIFLSAGETFPRHSIVLPFYLASLDTYRPPGSQPYLLSLFDRAGHPSGQAI